MKQRLARDVRCARSATSVLIIDEKKLQTIPERDRDWDSFVRLPSPQALPRIPFEAQQRSFGMHTHKSRGKVIERVFRCSLARSIEERDRRFEWAAGLLCLVTSKLCLTEKLIFKWNKNEFPWENVADIFNAALKWWWCSHIEGKKSEREKKVATSIKAPPGNVSVRRASRRIQFVT